MIVPKKSNRGTIIAIGTITLVIVIVIIVVNVVMFTTNKGLYRPYVPPPTPDNAVAPNGNTSNPGYEGIKFSATVNTQTQNNLNAYKGLNPSSEPTEFGFYK